MKPEKKEIQNQTKNLKGKRNLSKNLSESFRMAIVGTRKMGLLMGELVSAFRRLEIWFYTWRRRNRRRGLCCCRRGRRRRRSGCHESIAFTDIINADITNNTTKNKKTRDGTKSSGQTRDMKQNYVLFSFCALFLSLSASSS